MPDDAPRPTHPARQLAPATKLSHTGRPDKRVRGFVNPPVHRGSTVLYPSMADRRHAFTEIMEQAPTYGLEGTPTHYRLEDVVAEIEGGTRCQIVSSGLAACTTPLLAYLKAGDHLLMPDNCYGPTRDFCTQFLPRMAVETTFYEPCIDAAGLETQIRANTKVLYTESPGSHTFEMQDIPALAAVAHTHGMTVLLDNTWGVQSFQPFAHGVDVSILALTKYVAGHSDVMLGGIVTAAREHHEAVRHAALVLGQYASPDDCWLALRGARTMAVRMARQMASALAVAEWLRSRAEVAQVLYPALPGAPGHDIWRRDFTGAASLFGVELQPRYGAAAVDALVEGLTLFGIGASWGGYESLALPSAVSRSATNGSSFAGRLVRLHVGLEEPADLIADLESGLAALNSVQADD
jgi:cystathionine beta-lyase